MKTTTVNFTFDGTTYEAPLPAAYDARVVALPNGQTVAIEWSETVPPRPKSVALAPEGETATAYAMIAAPDP